MYNLSSLHHHEIKHFSRFWLLHLKIRLPEEGGSSGGDYCSVHLTRIITEKVLASTSSWLLSVCLCVFYMCWLIVWQSDVTLRLSQSAICCCMYICRGAHNIVTHNVLSSENYIMAIFNFWREYKNLNFIYTAKGFYINNNECRKRNNMSSIQ